MPASNSLSRSVTLPNGLRVALCSAQRLKCCAAVIRVEAGSHDVSDHWPGLAHFLEHLFFLGTERFPAHHNLMAYVQSHGGQLNASTQERSTEFFFELAPLAFSSGLERLCDMLAHPRLSVADQLREREVLHAEFIAWLRDDVSQGQFARLQSLSARHPLRGFHAGNRYSLPVPNPTFQRALTDFYRQFYQAGQMTLSLAGPQSLDELQALATRFGGCFAKGSRVERKQPPALVDNAILEQQITLDQRPMQLLFACETLPEGHEHAAAFLCTWINNAQAGGLVSRLRERGLAESLEAETLYAFGGQTLINVDIGLTIEKTSRERDTASDLAYSLIFDWLAFFSTHYRALLDEYALLEERRLAMSNALQLARQRCTEHEQTGLNEHAIDALLSQLTPSTLVHPIARVAPFQADWRLPSPNPFLRRAETPATRAALPSSFTFNETLQASGEGTVYLRWTLTAPYPALHQMLDEGLKPLKALAHQAGITLMFSALGRHWQLMLSGHAESIPGVLTQALGQLTQPDGDTLVRYGLSTKELPPIPIRQLLNVLPDRFLNSQSAVETDDLQSAWTSSHWLGFATGLTRFDRSGLIHALTHVPGTTKHPPTTAPSFIDYPRWETEPSAASEQAVLMFYPAPTNSIEHDADYRFFAHQLQTPFYQRLRVELQLGYAVFSAFRHINGQAGLLFGVQSPSASAEELVGHIETFLQSLPERLEGIDLLDQSAQLRRQLDPAAMDTTQAADMLWQAHLAGHGDTYTACLQHALAHLTADGLQATARQLTRPEASRLCVSNRARPAGWAGQAH